MIHRVVQKKKGELLSGSAKKTGELLFGELLSGGLLSDYHWTCVSVPMNVFFLLMLRYLSFCVLTSCATPPVSNNVP